MKKMILIALSLLNIQFAQADTITDLYNEIMPATDRTATPKETYKSFKVHLKDSDKSFPPMADITATNIIPFTGTKNFTGTQTYVTVFKKKYNYDVTFQNNKYVFNIRIALRTTKPIDYYNFLKKIKGAEAEWNNSRLARDFNYEFRFNLEIDTNKAHFTVNVLDTTRGPYDTNWGRDWDSLTISHEIGHMMGLGDEYQTLTSVNDCLMHSKMCDQSQPLMAHHYYFILRRLLK